MDRAAPVRAASATCEIFEEQHGLLNLQRRWPACATKSNKPLAQGVDHRLAGRESRLESGEATLLSTRVARSEHPSHLAIQELESRLNPDQSPIFRPRSKAAESAKPLLCNTGDPHRRQRSGRLTSWLEDRPVVPAATFAVSQGGTAPVVMPMQVDQIAALAGEFEQRP